MKKVFYFGILGLALLEIAKVYFIMPMPGSQRMNSLDLAYFIHTYRWYFRIIFIAMILFGSVKALETKRKWIPILALLPMLAIVYMFNFEMAADAMFKEPSKVSFASLANNTLNDSSVVVGVEINGQAKAYPMRYIIYHHQVMDTVGGKPVMVTYCSVCRTGRVFEPVVNGQPEKFRLVGMDHFNAMFEDSRTGSWWRQVNGEAVAGSLKGTELPELESEQLTLKKFFELHPNGLVMQEDIASKESYDSLGRFERGRSKGSLTKRDSLSWKDKSWVVGVEVNKTTKAYDWNLLAEEKVINDKVGETPIVIVLGSDGQSFNAFERTDASSDFTIRNDTISGAGKVFNFSGKEINGTSSLKRIKASQEFWHSWSTFYPATEKHSR